MFDENKYIVDIETIEEINTIIYLTNIISNVSFERLLNIYVENGSVKIKYLRRKL